MLETRTDEDNTFEEFEIRIDESSEEEEVQNKLLNRFKFLENENSLNKLYGDYNFDNEDESMISTWDKIIKFILEEICISFAIPLEKLKIYTKIRENEPAGLMNILQMLRYQNKYLTKEDIYNDKFYEINYPELYPKSGISGYISSFTSFFYNSKGNIGCCREEEDNNKVEGVRKDISYKDKIPENSILFNYELLNSHCNALIMALNDILNENNDEIITKDDYIKNIKENFLEDSKDSKIGRYKLRYGLNYIEEIIHYLSKMKKILLFKAESNGKTLEFIKVVINNDDTLQKKYIEMAKLMIDITILNEKIIKCNKITNQCYYLAKLDLKNKDKKAAKEKADKYVKLGVFTSKWKEMIKSIEKKISTLKDKNNDVIKEDIKINIKDVFFKEYDEIEKYISNNYNKDENETKDESIDDEEINTEFDELISNDFTTESPGN